MNPNDTMASACALMTESLIWNPYVFHELQPINGGCWALAMRTRSSAIAHDANLEPVAVVFFVFFIFPLFCG
jgi:hypothetical protein